MTIRTSYLAHHGIKGMKWGVRRYQNSDGSYTSAGKNRRKRTNSFDYESTKQLRKKSYKELSNQELKTLNKRMNLESEYKRLNPRGIFKGQQLAKTAIGLAGTVGGLYALSNTQWVKAGKEILKKARG